MGVDYKVCLGVDTMKWINVEDRLPEKNGYYITHYNGAIGNNKIHTLWFYADNKEGAEFSGATSVTHWMPLPALPEDK